VLLLGETMNWKHDAEPRVEIETADAAIEIHPYARIVTWIPWDSEFRATELHVGDAIIGHGGREYGAGDVEQKVRIGDARFGDLLLQRNFRPGSAVELIVLRDGIRSQLVGKVGGPRDYQNEQRQRILGIGGPVAFNKDGGDCVWEAWYAQFVELARGVLAGWDYFASLSTKLLSARVQLLEPRVLYLTHHYPGAFSRAVHNDFAAMQVMLAGEKRELSANDIAYRTLGKRRAAEITAAADRAFAALLAEVDDKLLHDMPHAPNSFNQDMAPLAGKLVRLPELGLRNVLYETRRSWYWSGANGGGYLVDRNSAAFARLYVGIREYAQSIDPSFRDFTAQFIGVVHTDPALVCDAARGITVTGVQVIPQAALLTNINDRDLRVHIDLRNTAQEQFAGQAALVAGIRRPALSDQASPEDVLLAAFDALKFGDMDAWLACYAPWQIRGHYERDFSYAWVDRTGVTMSEISGTTAWQKARQRVLDDVYDIEIARIGPVSKVFDADDQPSSGHGVAPIPRIVQQVTIVVNHIGRDGDEYRTFGGSFLHRKWQLQRLDDGPWRISISQAI
jgi:hypothetical protein